MALCNCKAGVKNKVHSVIEKFAERGLRSLAVARQVCPKFKEMYCCTCLSAYLFLFIIGSFASAGSS